MLMVVVKIKVHNMVHAQKMNGAPVIQAGALETARGLGMGRSAYFQATVLRRDKPVICVMAAGTLVRYLYCFFELSINICYT